MNTPFKGLSELKEVYFIGIGGIGMSAIARFFHSRGVRVSGYDKTSTVLTRELEAAGMSIRYDEDINFIPKSPDLVVYTPAIPSAHAGLVYYREQGVQVVKRSDVLQIISEGSFNICIAGTHGKTTVTTMIAHLLRHTGFGCNAFLGGISANYNTNFWSDPNNVCVIEADEYDRSFLKLSPDIAVITSMDPDHLDIYGTADSVETAFIDFSKRLKPSGKLLKRIALTRGEELQAETVLSYSMNVTAADVYAKDIAMEDGSYHFTAVVGEKEISDLTLNMGGMHNVENVMAAVATGVLLQIDDDKIRDAIAAFRGVRRRFEYIVKEEAVVYVDDYAHHPEELRAPLINARSSSG